MKERRRLRPDVEKIHLEGIDLNLAVVGRDDGPVLVLLHGLAARWQVFGPLLPSLMDDWRIVAPDFRGHGCSGHAPGTYVLPQFVADTREVLAAYSPDPPVIYGHSLGGWVGLWLAATQPVAALIVGDTAIQPRPIAPERAIDYMANAGLALRSLAKAQRLMDPAVMEEFRSDAMTRQFDPESLLPHVTCPVLLLQADESEGGLMSDDDVELATRWLSDSRHVRFDGVGHALHIHDPEAVLEAFERFLGKTA